MSLPVLVTTRALPPAVEARCRRDWDARLRPEGAALAGEALLAAVQGADALLCCPGDRLDAAAVAALPAGLRVLGTFSVGHDHVDVAACRARGLALVNTPDVLSEATAELALLLVLAACRRAGEGERLLRAGRWTGWTPTMLLGRSAVGRRLGILGMGRIGRALARMAAGVGMTVHYRNRTRLPPELEAGAVFHDEDGSFLAACDVLSLNAPGGAGTRHWLDARRLSMLPRGAVVVNTSRGTLVDDAALLAALEGGQVSAAGLDVFDGEPRVHPGYLAREDVVLLPHLGSNPAETREAMGALVLDGMEAVLGGGRPPNLVA